jgi:hypothetical protein
LTQSASANAIAGLYAAARSSGVPIRAALSEVEMRLAERATRLIEQDTGPKTTAV